MGQGTYPGRKGIITAYDQGLNCIEFRICSSGSSGVIQLLVGSMIPPSAPHAAFCPIRVSIPSEAHKTNETQRQGPGHPGSENQRKPETAGAHKGNKKKGKQGTERQQEQGDTKGKGQPPESSQRPGNMKEARAHGEPRSAKPTKQTAHSAKAQGTRGRKPKKATDKGGARITITEKRKKGGGEEGKQRTKTGATQALRGHSKAERRVGQRKR